jgi:hypothetical protein
MAPGAVGADRLPIEGSMNQAFGNLLCSVPGGRAAAACPAFRRSFDLATPEPRLFRTRAQGT